MLGVNSANVAYIGPIDNGPSSTIYSAASSSLVSAFYTSGSERMRIAANGDIGIGTTSPDAKLTVESSYGLVTVKSTTGSKRVALGGDAFTDAFVGTTTAHNFSVISGGSIISTFTTGGRVGIGTTAPATRLHIGAEVVDDNGYAYNGNTAMVVHQLPTSTTVLNDPQETLLLARQGTGGQAYGAAASFDLSRYENSSVNSRTRLDIKLAHASFLASPTIAMTLLSSGNVGIGTTTPGRKLAISGDGIVVDNGSSAVVVEMNSTTDYRLQATADWQIYDATNTATRFYITSAGNVGIGTSTTPAARLDVATASGFANTPSVRFWNNNGGGSVQNLVGLQIYGNLSNGLVDSTIVYGNTVNSYLAFGRHNGTSYSEQMRITAAGNVGIGTTAPGAQLHLNGTGDLRMTNAVNTSGFDIGLLGGTSDASSYIYNRANAPLFFGTNNAARMTISNAGDVGIGTTSPGYKLEVNGAFAATTKSFVINHPTKPGMKLRYGSLEGPENGVYIRGRLKGSNTIELPDYWIGLVDKDSITVNLTPIGKHQKLYVDNIADNTIVVGNGNLLNKEINCFYTIFAERKDVEKLEVEIIGNK